MTVQSSLKMNSTGCDSSLSLFSSRSNYIYTVTMTTSIIIAVLSPVTVTGNLLVTLAIWRNDSLRSPSYFLLAILSVEYFVSGLLIQPWYAAKQIFRVLKPSSLTKVPPFIFYSRLILGGVGTYATFISTLTVTLIAIERWLYMSRRRWMNSSRFWKFFVALLFLPIPLTVYRTLYILTGTNCKLTNTILFCFLVFCFLTTTLTYLQIFRIIRRHQQQVQANERLQSNTRRPFINMTKYKKSVYTILLILALFYLSHVPFTLSVALLSFWRKSLQLVAAFRLSAMFLFLSFSLNPFLYCWRIREIRDGAKQLVYKVICKDQGT